MGYLKKNDISDKLRVVYTRPLIRNANRKKKKSITGIDRCQVENWEENRRVKRLEERL